MLSIESKLSFCTLEKHLWIDIVNKWSHIVLINNITICLELTLQVFKFISYQRSDGQGESQVTHVSEMITRESENFVNRWQSVAQHASSRVWLEWIVKR